MPNYNNINISSHFLYAAPTALSAKDRNGNTFFCMYCRLDWLLCLGLCVVQQRRVCDALFCTGTASTGPGPSDVLYEKCTTKSKFVW